MFCTDRDVARIIIHSDQWEDALKNRTEGRKDALKKRTEARVSDAPKNRIDERGSASSNQTEGHSLEKQTTPFRKLVKGMPGYNA